MECVAVAAGQWIMLHWTHSEDSLEGAPLGEVGSVRTGQPVISSSNVVGSVRYRPVFVKLVDL